MTQYIIDIGAYPDDGQGSPLRTAFDYTNENFNQIFAAGPVLSNIQIGNNTITTTVLNSNLILSPSGIGRVQFNNTLFPRLDNVYDIGTPSLRFNSIYLGTGGINTTGGITTTGNITAGYFIGNGSQLTGIVATTGSEVVNGTSNILIPSPGSNIFVTVNGTSNVVIFANTGAYVAGQVSATGNISGNYILGNGALLTGINVGYGNSNVADFLPTYTGNLVSLTGPVTTTANVTGGNLRTAGQISATGNITGGNINTGRLNAGYITTGTTISAVGNIATSSYFIGDGSLLTGINANYGNANVAAFLPTYTGNLVSLTGPVTTTANVTGGNLRTSGTILASGNITAANLDTGRVNAANITASGLISAVANITTSAYFIGDGSQLTNLPAGNYSNANVAAFLPTYTGNLVSLTGPVTTTSNITGGNLRTAGQISATGNITGGNVDASRVNANTVTVNTTISAAGNITGNNLIGTTVTATTVTAIANVVGGNITTSGQVSATGNIQGGNLNAPGGTVTSNIVSATGRVQGGNFVTTGFITATGNITGGNVDTGNLHAANINVDSIVSAVGNVYGNNLIGSSLSVSGNVSAGNIAISGTFGAASLSASGNITGGNLLTTGQVSATGNISGGYFVGNGSQLTGITVSAGTSILNGNSNVIVAANGNITISSAGVSNIASFANTGVYVAGVVSTTGNVTGSYLLGNGAFITGLPAGYSNADVANYLPTYTGNLVSLTGPVITTANISGNYFIGNISQATGALGNNINMGTNSAGALVSNAVTLTTTTSVTNGIALLNQVLGKLVPPSPPNFPGANTLSLSGIATYRMANITQVDNTPGANKAVAAGTSVANVLRVATYATNTIANVGPGDSGIVTAVRNGANVGNVTLNTNASPSANGTYGGNLVISNNFDYNVANANITAGFWYVFSSRVSGSTAPAGWNELYIADTATANTNTTVWYYDNSSPSTPAFSSTSMTPPGSANLLYSSTIPHYTNNNNFTISFNVANISGNTYPVANTLASGSGGGSFAAPVTINYSGSNIGSNVLNSFASASANTTASITTGFGGSATGPSMSVNNSYSTGTLTLTTALANTVLYKSGTATAIDESNVVINTTIGTGSGNAYRIINPGAGNTPPYTGSEAAFNSQSSTLQTYDATVVGVSTSGVLKHDQTNYSTGYLPAGPNLSSGRTGTQYFTMKFIRTAVSKFDIKYTGNIAGMWVALPGSVIDSSSSANGWINMAVAYGGAGYPGVNSPGNGSDGCAVGGVVTLNTSVTNSSKTCTFGTVSSSSTASNEIYVRIALTAGQSVTALTLETASN